MNADTDVPPIILFVSAQHAGNGSHVAALEEAGFWVAESRSLEDALRDIVDLRPDLIVAGLTANTLDRHSQEFVCFGCATGECLKLA